MGHPFEFFAGEINFENLTKLENKKNGPSHNVPLIVFHIFLNCHRHWFSPDYGPTDIVLGAVRGSLTFENHQKGFLPKTPSIKWTN